MSRRADRGRLRALRILVLGACSLLLGVGAHLVAGGSLPGPGLLTVLALGLGMTGSVVTARRVRLGVLLVVLGAEQAVLHLVLAAGAHSGLAGGGTHLHHHILFTSPEGSVSSVGLGMWVAHALATLATAVLLARGEAWLWRLADRLTVSRPSTPRRSRAGLRPWCSPLARPLVRPLHTRTPRRGPPLAAATA